MSLNSENSQNESDTAKDALITADIVVDSESESTDSEIVSGCITDSEKSELEKDNKTPSEKNSDIDSNSSTSTDSEIDSEYETTNNEKVEVLNVFNKIMQQYEDGQVDTFLLIAYQYKFSKKQNKKLALMQKRYAQKDLTNKPYFSKSISPTTVISPVL